VTGLAAPGRRGSRVVVLRIGARNSKNRTSET
jgi:hypothetical protein